MKPIIFYRAWRLAVLLLLANLSALPAAPPGWWLEEDTRVLSEENAPNDFGPVNLGQLKHMATQARKHLDAFLPGGAGPAIDTLVNGFEPRSGVSYSPEELQAIRVANHSPANLGQVKAVAKPFYDRLAAEGYDTKANLITRGYPSNWQSEYPWDPQSPKTINYSPANLGQLKMVFSFDLGKFQPLQAIAQEASIPQDNLLAIELGSTGGGNNPPTYALVSSPEHGTVSLNGSSLSYYPNAHFHGADSLRFRVTKGSQSSEANVQITVTFVNQPPLVYVGGGRSVVQPDSLNLEGSVIDIDTPAQEINLVWTKVSGPGNVVFDSPNTLSTTASFSATGNYILRLSASDGTSARSDSLRVTVNSEAASTLPSVAMTAPSPNASFEMTEAIGLSATAAAGPDAVVTKVEFYEGSRKIGETSSLSEGTYSVSWEPPRLGIFAVSAIATDSNGSSNFSTPLVIRVTEAGWFSDSNAGDGNSPTVNTPGNEGYAGSGGDGGIGAGSHTGPGGSFGPGTGGHGGGGSAGGGGDGLGNTRDSDPFTIDTDRDGVTDGEEKARGTNVLIPDTDHDGASDLVDGWPLDPKLSPPRLPEISRFAVIPLKEDANAIDLNDTGHILLSKRSGSGQYLWKDGVLEQLTSTQGNQTSWLKLANNGIAYGMNRSAGTTSILAWSNGQANSTTITPYMPASMAGSEATIPNLVGPDWVARDGTMYFSTAVWGLKYIGTESYTADGVSIDYDKYREFEYAGMVAYTPSGVGSPLFGDTLITKTDKVYTFTDDEFGTIGTILVDEDAEPLSGITMGALSTSGFGYIHAANDKGVLFGSAIRFEYERTPYYPDEGLAPSSPWHEVRLQSAEESFAIYWNGQFIDWPNDHIPVCITNNDSPYFIRDNDGYDEDYDDQYRALKIWRLAPSMQLEEVYSAFTSPSKLTGVADDANSRLQLLGSFRQLQSGHEAEGQLIHNGRVVPITVDDDKWLNISATKINEHGLMVGTADRDVNGDGVIQTGTAGPDLRYAVLLIPLTVDYLSRNPHTGTYENLGGILAEAQPIPVVKVETGNVNLASNGTLTVEVQIDVRDPLSEITEASHLDGLTIYVNEEPYETVSNLAAQAQGETVPVWQSHKSNVTLNRTISIPDAPPGAVNIRVQTEPNAAGNVGWGGISVSLAKQATQTKAVSASRSVSFTISGTLSSQQVNQVALSVDGQSPSTLTETSAGSDVFTGSVATSGGTQTVSLWLESSSPQGALQPGQIRGTLDLSGESGRIIGLWQSSGGTYSLTSRYEWDESSRATLYVAGTSPLDSSPEDNLQPFVVRLTVPEGIAEKMLEPNSWLQLKLFDQDAMLVEKDDLIPGDAPASGTKHLYIAADDQPKLFAIVRKLAGDLAPAEVFQEESFSLELKAEGTENAVFDATVGVELQPDLPQPTASRSGLQARQKSSARSAQPYTVEEVLVWFRFFFGQYGEELLSAYSGTITVEPLDNLAPWHWKRYRVENWMQSDANAGRQLVIRLDNDQKSPVQAAQALFFAFQDCRGWLARYDFNQAAFDDVWFSITQGVSDAADRDIYQAFHQANVAPIGQALGDCALAAEIGLSIANPAADVVFTLNDIANHAQAGEWKQAGATIAIGAVLSGPVMKLAKRTGKKVIIQYAEGTIEITARIQNALVDVSAAANRAERMDALRPLIQSGELGTDFIEWAYTKTTLLTESRQYLEKNLAAAGKPRPGRDYRPHHMLPIIPNELAEPMELTFLKSGLDPNDAQFGRWLRSDIHNKIHGVGARGKGWGAGGPWNYQWKRFFEDHANTLATEAEIRALYNQLDGVVDDLIANPAKALENLNWRYFPE